MESGKAFLKEINPLMRTIKANDGAVQALRGYCRIHPPAPLRSCKCGEIYVDGGRECLRRLARNFDNLEELSEHHEGEGEASPKNEEEDPI